MHCASREKEGRVPLFHFQADTATLLFPDRYKKRQAEQEHADHERRLKKSKELDDPFASSALPANGAKNQPRPLSPAVKLGSGATPSASADPFK